MTTQEPGLGTHASGTPAGRSFRGCDSHFHVMGDAERYPFRQGHAFPFEAASLSEYRDAIAGTGIDRHVLVQPSIYGTDNRCLADTLAAMPAGTARGVAAIDDATPDEELRRLHERGVRGIRFNLLYGPALGMEAIDAAVARIADLGWHVEIYMKGEAIAAVAGALRDLPVPVVLDHMGQVALGEAGEAEQVAALRGLLDSGRVWIKLVGYRLSRTGYPFVDVDPFARTLVRHHADRCVWGSDWPNTNFTSRRPTPAELNDALARWAPGDEERRQILVDNPTELYDFAAS